MSSGANSWEDLGNLNSQNPDVQGKFGASDDPFNIARGVNIQMGLQERAEEMQATEKKRKNVRYQMQMHPKDSWAKMKPAGG